MVWMWRNDFWCRLPGSFSFGHFNNPSMYYMTKCQFLKWFFMQCIEEQRSCTWNFKPYLSINLSICLSNHILMMMNCFCGMVDRRKLFSLISSQDHYQRSWPSWISDPLRARIEPVQNLSSGLVEWSCTVVITTPRHQLVEWTCAVVITTTPRCHLIIQK